MLYLPFRDRSAERETILDTLHKENARLNARCKEVEEHHTWAIDQQNTLGAELPSLKTEKETILKNLSLVSRNFFKIVSFSVLITFSVSASGDLDAATEKAKKLLSSHQNEKQTILEQLTTLAHIDALQQQLKQTQEQRHKDVAQDVAIANDDEEEITPTSDVGTGLALKEIPFIEKEINDRSDEDMTLLKIHTLLFGKVSRQKLKQDILEFRGFDIQTSQEEKPNITRKMKRWTVAELKGCGAVLGLQTGTWTGNKDDLIQILFEYLSKPRALPHEPAHETRACGSKFPSKRKRTADKDLDDDSDTAPIEKKKRSTRSNQA
ncbi:hypothetical protein HK102_000687 [Quaeritorhiza haematococci]|nr:hypothetical protein HK102_000687 [Quaeritorhiza haematococci]